MHFTLNILANHNKLNAFTVTLATTARLFHGGNKTFVHDQLITNQDEIFEKMCLTNLRIMMDNLKQECIQIQI